MTQYVTHYHSSYLLTYSMQQSPSWDVNRFSASQEIPRILWNPKVHYCIYKFPPPVPILSQINPVHAPLQPTSWRSVLILSSHLRLGLPSCLFPSGFATKTCIHLSSHRTCYMPLKSHSSFYDYPNNPHFLHCCYIRVDINYHNTVMLKALYNYWSIWKVHHWLHTDGHEPTWVMYL